MKKIVYVIAILLLFAGSGHCQELVEYKNVDDTISLTMKVILPKEINNQNNYPAVVFFFGGGWQGGEKSQFERQAQYLANRGMVCFLPDYRVFKRQHTTPIESLKDAKSAVRYIREHSKQFHIDPEKLVCAGGSAGGHLAAACATIDGFNEITDNLLVSCIPNALVLFNPVFDNGPGGYGYERVGEKYKEFSPLHNLKRGAPPTIIFLGTKDKLVPVETAKYYQLVMRKVGSRCELELYKDAAHGFFNYASNKDYYEDTLMKTDQFLVSLGYIE